MTEGVNDSQCLSIFCELLDVWVVMDASSLALTAEKVLQGVLTNTLTQE